MFDPKGRFFHVTSGIACNDTYNKITNPILFPLTVDTSPPEISSLSAEPYEIIHYSSEGLQTVINAATNENSLCKISKATNSYAAMEKLFDGATEAGNIYQAISAMDSHLIILLHHM